MTVQTHLATAVILGAAVAAQAQRQIAADVYLDKLHGMWMGQVLGNYGGRGDVPGTATPREGYIVRGGGRFDIGWEEILSASRWQADDDTSLEYMYLDLLTAATDPSCADIARAWRENLAAGDVAIANRQARWLMEPPPDGAGLSPPDTGGIHHNMHFYAIDSQIATESLGALLPGMRQRAADLCETFASVTNEGYPVHAAQFYSAMYAAAAFESDVQTVVEAALEVVPTTSRTYEVIQAVRGRYEADRLAGNLGDPNAWRQTQTMLYDDYGTTSAANGRYRGWIESTVNAGLTTMAVLYGQGDFTRTVEIAVLGGYDADCNPATAGGLIGMIKGYQGPGGGILAELPAAPNDVYDVRCLASVGGLTTVSQVAADFQTAAEAQIVAAGGTIDDTGPVRIYIMDDDEVSPPPELPDPSGPKGLVARMLAAGGSVAVSASVEQHKGPGDREDLTAIIDGITDVTYNGHLPYWTDDGNNAQPPGGDYYQLTFPRPVTFRSVVFYEGDIRWTKINANPRLLEPKGGYFLDLTVEVLSGGEFREVSNLELSEPLDANEYYQVIELTFEPIVGEAVRIRGEAGGAQEFTSIVELEAYGGLGVPGDADEDGDVDRWDFQLLREHFGDEPAGWPDGDFNFDGKVDFRDYLALKSNLHAAPGGTEQTPEPATALLLFALTPLLMKRRRARAESSSPFTP